eukprot:scaffold135986_cov35-Attheya_sp.AAC.1
MKQILTSGAIFPLDPINETRTWKIDLTAALKMGIHKGAIKHDGRQCPLRFLCSPHSFGTSHQIESYAIMSSQNVA